MEPCSRPRKLLLPTIDAHGPTAHAGAVTAARSVASRCLEVGECALRAGRRRSALQRVWWRPEFRKPGPAAPRPIAPPPRRPTPSRCAWHHSRTWQCGSPARKSTGTPAASAGVPCSAAIVSVAQLQQRNQPVKQLGSLETGAHKYVSCEH